MTGSLTTHVLDTSRGCPAVNVPIEVWQLNSTGPGRTLLKKVLTNSNGRTDAPLLVGEEIDEGTYELVFEVGKYFMERDETPNNSTFLDKIPVRFKVSDRNAHYHVPLLATPWSYSTYRGS